MYSMNFDIVIGKYRLTALEKAAIKCSVENLADTADITLPGTLFNRTLEIEGKIAEGDAVRILLGYDQVLREEFAGYVLKNITVKALLTSVAQEVGSYEVECDYDFTYDSFTIHAATGYDVLRKVQSETKANIYLRGKTLHVHPQYAQIGGKVVYDFAVNIEKSDLKYRDATKRKFLAVVEGTDAQGKTIRIERGTTGGDKFTLKLPGVSDRKSLEQRADEELKVRAYTGYEGSFTGWLEPYVEPTWLAEIRDGEYEYKNGSYYVLSVETTFCDKGASRVVTIGKRIEGNG